MVPGVFHRAYVTEQLRCLGILATCEVLKDGLPTRITYRELKRTLVALPSNTQGLFILEVGCTWVLYFATNAPNPIRKILYN